MTISLIDTKLDTLFTKLKRHIDYMSFAHSNNDHWLLSKDDIMSECSEVVIHVATKYNGKPVDELAAICEKSIFNRIMDLKRKAYSKHRKEEMYGPSLDDEDLNLQIRDTKLNVEDAYESEETLRHLENVLTEDEIFLLNCMTGHHPLPARHMAPIRYVSYILDEAVSIEYVVEVTDDLLTDALNIGDDELQLLKISLKEKLNHVFNK